MCALCRTFSCVCSDDTRGTWCACRCCNSWSVCTYRRSNAVSIGTKIGHLGARCSIRHHRDAPCRKRSCFYAFRRKVIVVLTRGTCNATRSANVRIFTLGTQSARSCRTIEVRLASSTVFTTNSIHICIASSGRVLAVFAFKTAGRGIRIVVMRSGATVCASVRTFGRGLARTAINAASCCSRGLEFARSTIGAEIRARAVRELAGDASFAAWLAYSILLLPCRTVNARRVQGIGGRPEGGIQTHSAVQAGVRSSRALILSGDTRGAHALIKATRLI
jgi:hypothetical protein